MFSEMTWLGAVLIGLGVLVVGVPILWMIVRAARDRTIARDPKKWRRRSDGSEFRRIHRSDDQN